MMDKPTMAYRMNRENECPLKRTEGSHLEEIK